MFYLQSPDNELRFGDILLQQTTVSTNIQHPSNYFNQNRYDIQVLNPKYSVVLTPCCSIDDNILVLSPLKRIDVNFYKNSYLAEDLMRINKKMTAEQSIPPARWQPLSQEEKNSRTAEGLAYAFVDYFIYEEHDLLEKYTIEINQRSNKIEKNIGNYMIDFRNVTITTSKNIKSPDGLFIANKITQLTIEARAELRDKISSYYSRPPKEDLVQED